VAARPVIRDDAVLVQGSLPLAHFIMPELGVIFGKRFEDEMWRSAKRQTLARRTAWVGRACFWREACGHSCFPTLSAYNTERMGHGGLWTSEGPEMQALKCGSCQPRRFWGGPCGNIAFGADLNRNG